MNNEHYADLIPYEDLFVYAYEKHLLILFLGNFSFLNYDNLFKQIILKRISSFQLKENFEFEVLTHIFTILSAIYVSYFDEMLNK